MTDDPIDFGPIDPTRDAETFERRVAQIHFAASGIMARRRNAGTAFVFVARWRAPLLAALLVVTLVSVALLRTVGVDAGLETDMASDEVAEVLGATTPMSELLLSTSASPTDALLDGGMSQ
jgi:hypothetical protein